MGTFSQKKNKAGINKLNRCRKGLIYRWAACLLAILVCSSTSYGQYPYYSFEKRYTQSAYGDKLDSLRRIYDGEFEFVGKDGIELAALLAKGYYPDLKNVRIKVIYKDHKRAPIIATIDVWNFLRGKKKRIYKVIVRNNSFVERISLNKLVGLVGHEFAHFSFYHTKSSLSLLGVAISYNTSKKYHYRFEKGADTLAIHRGLGWQYQEMSIYMNQQEVRELMERKGYWRKDEEISGSRPLPLRRRSRYD